MGVALEGLTAPEQAGVGPIDGNGLFRYRPASPMLAETVHSAVELYTCRPLAAVMTILASPGDKIQTFADAFRFREWATPMFEPVVYLLCTLTSALCAWLLMLSYRRNRQSLLLWSSICFCLLSLNSLLVFVDIVVLPKVDLSSLRLATSLVAVSVLLYGFVWEID